MIFSGFIEEFREAIYSGDPIPREWFLVGNDYLPFIICTMYVLFVKYIGPWYMQDKRPYELRTLMIVYNFAVVVTYVSGMSVFFYALCYVDLKYLCITTSLAEVGYYELLAVKCGWICYVIKYVEFLDTAFLVLRKKNHLITNLHVVHHFSVPLIGWILFRSERSGFQTFPAFLNTLVHIVMYTYYALAAIGPSMRKYLWWKKYLTLAQMLQFVLDILYAVVFWPWSGCANVKFGIYLDIIMGCMFLSLFYNFYVHTFVKTERKQSVN